MIKASGLYMTLDDVDVVTIQCRQSKATGGKWWIIQIEGETIAAVFPKAAGSTDIIIQHEPELI